MAEITVWGRMEVLMDGKPVWAMGDWTIDPGVDERESLVSTDGRFAGVKATPRLPKAKGKVLYSSGTNITDLTSATPRELQFSFGKRRLVFRNAIFTGSGEIDAGTGEIDSEFTAESMEEMA